MKRAEKITLTKKKKRNTEGKRGWEGKGHESPTTTAKNERPGKGIYFTIADRLGMKKASDSGGNKYRVRREIKGELVPNLREEEE